MTLLGVALRDQAVKGLYDEVSLKTLIAVTESDHGDGWTSITQNGQTSIGASPTKAPAAALAHELLHAKLKLAGYHQFSHFVSKPEHGQMLKMHLEALDNELQHHRIFDQYLALGLPAKHFYRDNDIHTFRKIRRELDRSKKTDSFDLFLPLFLSVIAPGGAGTEIERAQLRRYFETRCSALVWNKLLQVEAAFADWRDSSSLEASETIRRVLSHSDFIDRAWFGTSSDPDEFPGSGTFIGKPFFAEEAAVWHGL